MGTAAAAGDLWDTGRSRLQEDDPEALLLQAPPAGSAQHGEHVGASVESGQVLVTETPQQLDRGVDAVG